MNMTKQEMEKMMEQQTATINQLKELIAATVAATPATAAAVTPTDTKEALASAFGNAWQASDKKDASPKQCNYINSLLQKKAASVRHIVETVGDKQVVVRAAYINRDGQVKRITAADASAIIDELKRAGFEVPKKKGM